MFMFTWYENWLTHSNIMQPSTLFNAFIIFLNSVQICLLLSCSLPQKWCCDVSGTSLAWQDVHTNLFCSASQTWDDLSGPWSQLTVIWAYFQKSVFSQIQLWCFLLSEQMTWIYHKIIEPCVVLKLLIILARVKTRAIVNSHANSSIMIHWVIFVLCATFYITLRYFSVNLLYSMYCLACVW